MAVILLIELDDSSHYDYKRQERDCFVDMVYVQTGYKILHVYSSDNNLEQRIIDILRPPMHMNNFS